MRPAVIIVGAVAFIAAAGTGVLLTHVLNQPPPAVPGAPLAPPKITTLGVLAAAAPEDVGKTLDSAAFQWLKWPEHDARDAATHGAIVADSDGQAAAQKPFEGAIARTPLYKGEMITEDKVAHPDKASVLAVALAPGYRSMTIPVDNVMGAGGMIQPGDHVDLMLTMDITYTGAGTIEVTPKGGRVRPKIATETIMRDLKVIATDRRLTANPDPATPVPGTISLQVTPEQAERLATAKTLGRFNVMMRPLANGKEPAREGFGLTTDVAVVPDFVAAIKGVPVTAIDPKENPFHQATDAFGRPSSAGGSGAPDDGEERQGITVFRFTTPTFVPMHGAPNASGAPAAKRPFGGVPSASARDPAPLAETTSFSSDGDPYAGTEGQAVASQARGEGSDAGGIPVLQFDRAPDDSVPNAPEQGSPGGSATPSSQADGGGDQGAAPVSGAEQALDMLQPKNPNDDVQDNNYLGKMTLLPPSVTTPTTPAPPTAPTTPNPTPLPTPLPTPTR
jgi:pilus assembly protein CpaB